MKRIVFLLLLILASATSNAASPNVKDITVLRNACMQLKKDKQKDCLNSLARLEGKPSVESNVKLPNKGMAKEEITFKGVYFDLPNQLDKLIGICAEKKDNLERMIGSTNFESECKAGSSGNMWFKVDYGTLKDTYMSFNLNETGALVSVSQILDGYEVAPMVAVLTEKYGQPEIIEDEIQNKMGNKFDRQVYTWMDSKINQIKIYSRYNKIDEGYIEIKSASEILASTKKTIELITTGKEKL